MLWPPFSCPPSPATSYPRPFLDFLLPRRRFAHAFLLSLPLSSPLAESHFPHPFFREFSPPPLWSEASSTAPIFFLQDTRPFWDFTVPTLDPISARAAFPACPPFPLRARFRLVTPSPPFPGFFSRLCLRRMQPGLFSRDHDRGLRPSLPPDSPFPVFFDIVILLFDCNRSPCRFCSTFPPFNAFFYGPSSPGPSWSLNVSLPQGREGSASSFSLGDSLS